MDVLDGAVASVSAAELVARLRELAAEHERGGLALAFDGDGTLWSGDVGDDVFLLAAASELLREEARPALEREARRFGLPTQGTPSQIARRLFDAYHAGVYPERDVYAMMAWCFAGWTPAELDAFAIEALRVADLPARLEHNLLAVFEFAREAELLTAVVSASPQFAVERAAAAWGVLPEHVGACRPRLAAGRLEPELTGAVPYGEHKPQTLRALIAGRGLLASFGDNAFDVDLLRAARVPVAVRPKPALRRRFAEIPGISVLE